MKAKIKTIDVQAKEWFDKTYGNSYFSARVTINFGLPGQMTIYLPFQYGYGNHSEHMAFEAIKKNVNKTILKNLPHNVSYWNFCQQHKIVWRYSRQENCLQRDVKSFGIED